MQQMINNVINPNESTEFSNGVELLKDGCYYRPPFNFNIEDIRKGVLQTKINNDFELYIHFSHLYNVVSSLLKFDNVPDIYSGSFLLRILIQYGSCAICKDSETGTFYIAPYNPINAVYNEMGEPVEITLQDFSLFGLGRNNNMIRVKTDKIFRNSNKNKEFVIINSTATNMPLFCIIYYYALKIIDVQSAIDNNLFVMQQPVIFTGTDEQKLTMQGLWERLTNKVRAMFVIKRSGQVDAKMEVLDLKAQNNLESFQAHKEYVKKEFFEFFGINAVPYEKKERLIVDEVKSNNMLLEIVQNSYYNTIRDSIEHCNEVLGTNITVEFNVNGFIDDSTIAQDKGSEESDANYNETI